MVRTLFFIVALAVGVVPASQAGVILSLPEITVVSDPSKITTHFIDVWVQPVSPVKALAGYNVSLLVEPMAGLSFISADEPPQAVFAGQDPFEVGTGPILQAYDFLQPNESREIGLNQQLIRAVFEVAAGAQGEFVISFNPPETLLSDREANEIPIDSFVAGKVHVTVPEPMSIGLLGLGIFCSVVLSQAKSLRNHIRR